MGLNVLPFGNGALCGLLNVEQTVVLCRMQANRTIAKYAPMPRL